MDSEIVSGGSSEIIKADLSNFETYLSELGLPTNEVIAPPDERLRIMNAIPEFVNSLPPEVKADARYLSKFIAGSAVGLFDASLNFVWNEVVLNLRKKVTAYGLDYFYDSAVGGTLREQYSSEEDLPAIKDQVLLDTCKKLELVSTTLYKKLCHILDMRNQIGSSHPNEYLINSYELLGWLQTCIQEVFMDRVSESAVTVKSIVDNVKRSSSPLDREFLATFEQTVKELSPGMVSNLLTVLFGLFVSPSFADNNIQRQNIMLLSEIAWEYSTEKVKYDLGEKIDSYRANLDEYKTEQSELFFERCDGARYFTVDSRTIKLTLLCEQLITVHYGWDNFANETPVAREIMTFISSISDIPEIRLETVLRTFLICRIGNGSYYNNGVSPSAQKYYDQLFEMLDQKSVIVVLEATTKNDSEISLAGEYRQQNAKEIYELMKSAVLNDRCIDMLDFLISYSGNLESVSRAKEFRELKNGLF